MALRSREFIEIPGDQVWELPPLVVRSPEVRTSEKTVAMAEKLVEAASPECPHPLELALNLASEYQKLSIQWSWGNQILKWVQYCEEVFRQQQPLRPLLRPDLWPNAGRSSFVRLLERKMPNPQVPIEDAVGLRLTYEKLPPVNWLSEDFLLYLKSSLAVQAYHAWDHLVNDRVPADLPPERFHFQIGVL